MQFIEYGNYIFHGDGKLHGLDGLVMSGTARQSVALVGSELSKDTFTFTVNSLAVNPPQPSYAFVLDSDGKYLKDSNDKFIIVALNAGPWPDYRNFQRGAALDLFNEEGGTRIGRFYVENVSRTSRNTVTFTCTDCIGILEGLSYHNGGIYAGETAGSIIAELFEGSGLNYDVAADVAAEKIYGRLPRDNRRTNLGKILLATGAVLVDNAQGVIEIKYLASESAAEITESAVYLDGQQNVTTLSPVNRIELTEHQFFALPSDNVVTLYDNGGVLAAADHELITFKEACHDLTADGLTIHESGANYAIVSGVGTLTGKEYTHTRRVYSYGVLTANPDDTLAINDIEVLTYTNSRNVARRLMAFYGLEVSVSDEAVDYSGTIAPGDQVNIVDPYGDARSAWVTSKTFDFGNKMRASFGFAVDWQPGPYGSNFNDCEIITASGTWTNPHPGAPVRFVIAQGGQGGQAGFDGENATKTNRQDSYYRSTTPGEGGEPGEAGQAGKVFIIDVEASAASYTLTVGAAGVGGQTNGEYGAEGGHSTVVGGGITYTSDNGAIPADGYVEVMSGQLFSSPGIPGEVKGGKGGGITTGSTYRSNPGEDVVYNDWVWAGGLRSTYPGSSGGGGGGAAYGSNGGNASGINGGDGADAVTFDFVPVLGGGSAGGNGGGGGGCGAFMDDREGNPYVAGGSGYGGRGSSGLDGGAGYIIVYY